MEELIEFIKMMINNIDIKSQFNHATDGDLHERYAYRMILSKIESMKEGGKND